MRFIIILVIAVTAIGSLPVAAADIRVNPSRNLSAILEGRIETGDFEKVRSFLFSEWSLEIYLASPGGDLAEAIKIGRLFRSLKLETRAPAELPNNSTELRMHILKDPKANFMCASACFFVFVAGIKRYVEAPGGRAFLGIHRPYLSESDLQSATSDEAIASTNRTKAIVEGYLKEMGVPAKYADEMFGISKNDIRWISHDEVEADFDGFIPELQDWVDARCDKRSDNEKTLWEQAMHGKTYNEMSIAERATLEAAFEKHQQQLECEHKVQTDLAIEAYGQALQIRKSTPQSDNPIPK